MNSAVFPGSMGGPHMHTIAAKAICAEEMLSQNYGDYIHQVVTNARLMAKEFQHLGYRIVSGGTANHMFLVDLSDKGLTGKECQDLLERNHIAVNKNAIPNDPQPTSITSGIRIGTPAMTTKGWLEDDFIACADRIDALIKEYVNEKV